MSVLILGNELLRRQFAEKANAVGPWIERQLDAVTAIGMGLQVRKYFIFMLSLLSENKLKMFVQFCELLFLF